MDAEVRPAAPLEGSAQRPAGEAAPGQCQENAAVAARRCSCRAAGGPAVAASAAAKHTVEEPQHTVDRSTPWIAGAKRSAAMFGGFYAGCALDPTCQWSIDRRGGRDGTPATTGMEDADRKKGSWLILGHSHKAEKAKQLNAGIPEQNASNQIFIVTLT